MIVDRYAGSAPGWATGATLVYGPVASELLTMWPAPLEGRAVLDAGAGTGVVSAALAASGARPVAVDFSHDMLVWDARARPPAAVADVAALPLAEGSVDGAVAAFVLNHLVDPAAGFAELARVTRPGGVLLACVFANNNRSHARDCVDEVARQAGWMVPDWYLELKATATPLLGSAPEMARCAAEVGLIVVDVDERPVDVGVDQPEQLVTYRFGQAHFTDWLQEIGAERARHVRAEAADAIRVSMSRYQPAVVFLSARVS